ncbi:MAG: type II secretion system protein [Pirellula sp.]
MNTQTKMRRHPSVRRALTLVELLVAIGLIGFVASMFLVAYRGAAAEATRMRSMSTIRKIHEVLIARMQEYENLPVAFTTPIPANAVPVLAPNQPGYEPATLLIERARLAGLRELMCIEMPDHPDDIKYTTEWLDYEGLLPTTFRATGLQFWNGSAYVPVVAQVPETTRMSRIRNALRMPDSPVSRPIVNWEVTNANAELLYLIVEDSTLNGTSAMEMFGRTEIGDTDGDGLREFLDANRRPIQWIRWPSGFPGALRYHPDLLDPALIDPWTKLSRFTGDSLDRSRADIGFSLSSSTNLKGLQPDVGTFPLVVSSGADGQFGLRFEFDPTTLSALRNAIRQATNSTEYFLHQYSQMPAPTSSRYYSQSACNVEFPAPYRALQQGLVVGGARAFTAPDPWFPRLRPPASNVDLSGYRLGAIIPERAKFYEDDITNYDLNGASL